MPRDGEARRVAPPTGAGEAARCDVTGAPSGSRLAFALVRETLGAAPVHARMAEAARDAKVGAALDLAREHRPRDGVQGAMASLASGLLLGANDLMRRAQAPGLPPQLVLQTYRTAARLSDAFVAVSDAIARRQGGGTRQLVRVEHVTVAAGANAIIGSVGPANGEGGP